MMTSEVYGVLGIIIATFIISVLLIWWASPDFSQGIKESG